MAQQGAEYCDSAGLRDHKSQWQKLTDSDIRVRAGTRSHLSASPSLLLKLFWNHPSAGAQSMDARRTGPSGGSVSPRRQLHRPLHTPFDITVSHSLEGAVKAAGGCGASGVHEERQELRGLRPATSLTGAGGARGEDASLKALQLGRRRANEFDRTECSACGLRSVERCWCDA